MAAREGDSYMSKKQRRLLCWSMLNVACLFLSTGYAHHKYPRQGSHHVTLIHKEELLKAPTHEELEVANDKCDLRRSQYLASKMQTQSNLLKR